MEEERKKLEKMYQELNEEDTNIKKWNQAFIPKAILLFPPIAFALTHDFPGILLARASKMYVHTHVYIWKGWRCASVSYMNIPVGVVLGMITLLGLALSAHILRCNDGCTNKPSERASIRITSTSTVNIDWYMVMSGMIM